MEGTVKFSNPLVLNFDYFANVKAHITNILKSLEKNM